MLQEYLEFYNTERPHRSLALEPPLRRGPVASDLAASPGRVVARRVLGGLHNVYQRAAQAGQTSWVLQPRPARPQPLIAV